MMRSKELKPRYYQYGADFFTHVFPMIILSRKAQLTYKQTKAYSSQETLSVIIYDNICSLSLSLSSLGARRVTNPVGDPPDRGTNSIRISH